MHILVLNCGSSTIKFQLFTLEGLSDTDAPPSPLIKGLVERIGTPGATLHVDGAAGKTTSPIIAADFPEALTGVLNYIESSDRKVDAIGHRVVHGGEEFIDSVLIDEEVEEGILECAGLAPLHNPPNLMGIQAARKAMPGVPNVAVFDTAFHHSMPRHAYMYALPYDLYRRFQVRRYGFHGTSHRFVSQRAARLLGRPLDQLRLISAHLGNGCSVAAIQHGRSIDTSMGLTPLEGLVMGTRCGDLDPAVVSFLMAREHLGPTEVDALLNKRSGLLGLSNMSGDVRDLLQARSKGDVNARLALEVYCYRIRKYIGAYAAAMGGLDAVVFTAGVGENAVEVRAQVCDGLEFMGIHLDAALNDQPRSERRISRPDSRVAVVVVPTNEEWAIALETRRVLAPVTA